MSLAVDRWPTSVKPWQFLNVVLDIPRALAVLFILLEKAASLPEIASPIAVAASFADIIAAALIRYFSLIF